MLLSAVRAVNSYNPESGSDLEVRFVNHGWNFRIVLLDLQVSTTSMSFGFSVLFLEFYV